MLKYLTSEQKRRLLAYDYSPKMAPRAFVDYKKLSLILLLTSVAYNEFFGYYSSYLGWPSEAHIHEKRNLVTFALIADPQIQGFDDEPKGFLGVQFNQRPSEELPITILF